MTVMLGHCPQAERSRPLKVALIGECMIEMRGEPGATFSQTFGGDTLNAAVYLARVSQGSAMVVDYITAVGADAFSVAMRQMWRDEGVGDQHVRVIPDALPGLYFIQTDDQGERRFAYWRGEAAARRVFDGPQADALLSALADYDYVYVSGISLAILTPGGRERLMQALSLARAAGTRIVFDNNYRPHLWPDVHAARQAYIGVGTALIAAAQEKVDSVPMEGFDPAKVDEILGLTARGHADTEHARIVFCG